MKRRVYFFWGGGGALPLLAFERMSLTCPERVNQPQRPTTAGITLFVVVVVVVVVGGWVGAYEAGDASRGQQGRLGDTGAPRMPRCHDPQHNRIPAPSRG